MSLNNKPNRSEALEYYRRVTQIYSLDIRLFEAVNKIEKKGDAEFVVTTSRDVYAASNIVVSTGFYDIPVMLNVPGEDLEKVRHYYKDPHYYAFQKWW